MSLISKKYHYTARIRRALALTTGLLTCSLGYGDGPGLSNTSQPSTKLFKSLSAFDSQNGTPRGHGFVTMHRGYLIVIGARDGGGGVGTASLALYDISNPAEPVNTFTTVNNSNYGRSTQHFAGDFREAHAIAFREDYMAVTSSDGQGGVGIQIWDMSNLDKPNGANANSWFGPRRVAFVDVPGLVGGDYQSAPWSLSWNGRYIYVAGSSVGLGIIDAADPENPFLVNRGPGKPNPVPLSELGGVDNGMHQINTMGNILVQGRTNITTIDISDPLNPVLGTELEKEKNDKKPGYSIAIRGDRAYGFGVNVLNTYNISNFPSMNKLTATSINGYSGGYGIFQDNYLHTGGGSLALKVNINGNPPFNNYDVLTPDRPEPRDRDFNLFRAADWDFSTPLGNLTFVANDHGSGSALMVHDTQPDTNGPNVVAVNPKNNATNQPTTSRVGIHLADQVDVRTLNNNNFYVRKVGTNAKLAGYYAHNLGIVNFHPTQGLDPNSTYEVIVRAGGLKDFAGNTVDTAFRSVFSTGNSINNGGSPLTASLANENPVTAGSTVNFSVSTSGGQGTVDVNWSFGDGTTADTNTNTSVNKTFNNPGHYNVMVTVTRGQSSVTDSLVLTVHNPVTSNAPTNTSTIIYDSQRTKVWNVNTDSNTISAINPNNGNKLHEDAAGQEPRTLAKAPDGNIWVANKESDSITVHNSTNGNLIDTISFPRGSGPFGVIFSPNGANAFVTLETSWEIVKLNPSTRNIISYTPAQPYPKGMAINANSSRLYVTRFISDGQGEVSEYNTSNMSLVRTIALAKDTSPDTEDNGRGVPNYLVSPVISPDGKNMAIPSTKVNIDRGTFRDGVALDFDNTVRTITSFIDLDANAEDAGRRVDLNDRDSAVAGAYSPLGDYVFVVTQGSNSIEVLDAYTGAVELSILETGLAPRGVAINPSGTRLYVQNFMSRDVKRYDISSITEDGVYDVNQLSATDVVTNEALSNSVLKGKQIFYNAADIRMSQDNYLSCASCHNDGGQDGQIWDFTNRGEGLRNTIELNGRSGLGHGLLHWSANFDEVQDFENDIRLHQGGTGFLTNVQFANTEDTLGAPKAGLDNDLDDLAAYISSLDTVGKSPFRDPDGSLSSLAELGQQEFVSQNCVQCHIPENDYRDGVVHNVGTIKNSSGSRLGANLPGIDTPSLIGLWDTAPYFHDGSAATLEDTLSVHTGVNLNTQQVNRIVAFLLEIEDGVAPPTGPVDYTDNFSDNNISDWTSTGGTWNGVGGEVLSTQNFGGNNNDAILYYNAGSNWSDYTLTFDMSTTGDNDSMGAVFYYQDVDNHLGFFATADYDGGPRWALYSMSNGNRTILDSVAQGYNDGQVFSVTVTVETGGQITVSSGTGITLSAATPSGFTGGTIGFYTEYNVGARFDNVTVSSEGGQADLTPTITTTSLPGGQENSAYSATLQADSGDGSLSWNISSGSLPAGLSLSSSGVISGTPTAAGTSNFTARVQDADGDAATKSLSIVIAPDNGGTGDTTTLEVEGLTASSSQSTNTYNDGGASGGQWFFVDGVGVGSAVEFTVNVAPDTYNVSYIYKRQGSRGIIQLKVNGANVGSAIDQRNGSGFVTTPVLGTVTLNASNTFRFEAVGTNGTDHNIAVDAIILESTGGGGNNDLGPEYEAEAFDTATSVVGPWVEITDASASGGKYMEVPENSVGNTGLNPAPATGYLDFEFELDSAGPVYFWIHGQAPAVNGYGGDSIHIDVLGDGIGPNLWNNIFLASEHGTWVWKEWTNNKPASLGAGFHTLRIYYREDGFKLDQIAISSDPNYSPN